MDSTKLSQGELTWLLFSAKAAAYVSPMTVKEWQDGAIGLRSGRC